MSKILVSYADFYWHVQSLYHFMRWEVEKSDIREINAPVTSFLMLNL